METLKILLPLLAFIVIMWGLRKLVPPGFRGG